MKILQNFCYAFVVTTLAWMGLSTAAHADTITTELFQTTTRITGSNLNHTEFKLSSPGTLVVKLDDLNSPGLLDSLSFTLSDATQFLATFKLEPGSTTGSWLFNVAAPTTLCAFLFAEPSAALKAGMYSASVSFQTQTAPVPLPAAVWLLFSGLVGLAGIGSVQKRSMLKLSQT